MRKTIITAKKAKNKEREHQWIEKKPVFRGNILDFRARGVRLLKQLVIITKKRDRTIMSDNQDEPQRGDSEVMEVDAKVGGSQMDGKGGYDQADASGLYPEDPSSQGRQQPAFKDLLVRFESNHQFIIFRKIHVITEIADIRDDEFNSQTYKTCENVGKAVIVSNFMDGYLPRRSTTDLKDKKDIPLYCFFVMSYGRSGLIRCHREPGEKGDHPFVEQKHLQEAFQPQNNHSLALKPKLFIIQTIPEATSEADAMGGTEVTTTKRIPREADFLTYACDQYCIKDNNVFIDSVVHVLNNLAKEKEERKPAMEIQKVLIRMNKHYKDTRKYKSWKLPCVTSSLTKQLILF
ncbi:CASP3 [Mytilus edulis]|uniref:CASP3 n=1 Tax=Mytilus edulis TaxID=6550 RepID=A0A8S3SFJ0_MYTED|nr:CASP3 [Mytilus edulis]